MLRFKLASPTSMPTALPRAHRQVLPSLDRLGPWERVTIQSTGWPLRLDVSSFDFLCFHRPPSSNNFHHFPLDLLTNSCWVLSGISTQERLVVSKVDIVSCPSHHFPVVRMLSKLCPLHSLSFCLCNDVKSNICASAVCRTTRGFGNDQVLDLAAAAVPSHLHISNPNHLVMGGGKPPTSLADSILSTVSVSLTFLPSG